MAMQDFSGLVTTNDGFNSDILTGRERRRRVGGRDIGRQRGWKNSRRRQTAEQRVEIVGGRDTAKQNENNREGGRE